MIYTVVDTHRNNYLITGKEVLMLYKDAILICRLQRPSLLQKQATIPSLLWQLDTIQASPHQISTFSSCQPPKTVTALRSIIGAYKVLIEGDQEYIWLSIKARRHHCWLRLQRSPCLDWRFTFSMCKGSRSFVYTQSHYITQAEWPVVDRNRWRLKETGSSGYYVRWEKW
jgi:hypothetical protein